MKSLIVLSNGHFTPAPNTHTLDIYHELMMYCLRNPKKKVYFDRFGITTEFTSWEIFTVFRHHTFKHYPTKRKIIKGKKTANFRIKSYKEMKKEIYQNPHQE